MLFFEFLYVSPMYLSFTVNRIANNGFKPFEMLFKASRCDDLDLLKSFTGEFSTVLKDMVRSDMQVYRHVHVLWPHDLNYILLSLIFVFFSSFHFFKLIIIP